MKILLFGATGSAGGSVLRRCLADPSVTEVRVIVRRPLAISHDKLRSFAHGDFLDYANISGAFTGVDACLYCLGVSAFRVSAEPEYRRITHDFAVAAARALTTHSPSAAFHFVSGQSTSLDSRFMWARVKAETERDVMQIAGAVCWRASAIDGEPSTTPTWYSPFRPLFRLLRPFRSLYVSGEDLERAMLQEWRRRNLAPAWFL